jgi:maleate isomerase
MSDDLAPPRVDARIGLIIPSSNRLTEPQMRQYAPPGVEVHVTRLRMTGASHVPLPELLPRVVEATAALDDAGCDMIVFHCTASSMEAGLAGERQVLEAMRGATDGSTPVATTASAVLAAFQALEVRRIVLVSPYTRATHEHELTFLAEAGLEVVAERALELPGSHAYVAEPPATWLSIGVQLMQAAPSAQALFLSCTNIHSLPVIDRLEARLADRPVVASNQAVLWYGLRQVGLADRVPSLGRLFSLSLPVPQPA